MDEIKIDTIKNVIIYGLTILLVMVSTYTYFSNGEYERLIEKKDQQIENLMNRI